MVHKDLTLPVAEAAGGVEREHGQRVGFLTGGAATTTQPQSFGPRPRRSDRPESSV